MGPRKEAKDSRKICERGVPGNFYLAQPPYAAQWHLLIGAEEGWVKGMEHGKGRTALNTRLAADGDLLFFLGGGSLMENQRNEETWLWF